MNDTFVRTALVYSITGISILGCSVLLALHARHSYWRKLRRTGDMRAKAREMQRKRKR